jgi:hypothetical protein
MEASKSGDRAGLVESPRELATEYIVFPVSQRLFAKK